MIIVGIAMVLLLVGAIFLLLSHEEVKESYDYKKYF